MFDQDNLFATPQRPKLIRISLERAWTAGDDVVTVSTACHGSKGSEPAWTTHSTYQGDHWWMVAQCDVEASIARWTSSVWNQQPRTHTYDQWMANRTTY
jgi:hypothetical protein